MVYPHSRTFLQSTSGKTMGAAKHEVAGLTPKMQFEIEASHTAHIRLLTSLATRLLDSYTALTSFTFIVNQAKTEIKKIAVGTTRYTPVLKDDIGQI